MFKQYKHQFFIFFLVFNVILTIGSIENGETTSPITPKSLILRYWNHQITNNISMPYFLFSKSTPLTTVNTSFFTKLVIHNSLSSHLDSFCTSANLCCFPKSYSWYAVDPTEQDNFGYGAPLEYQMENKQVEPGKFFHESLLKQGTIIPMPDIRDKMPERSFLPRVISSKLPFSTSRLTELKQNFHVQEHSEMEDLLKKTLQVCDKEPNKGETKRCVGSMEDMIDFAVSILGHNLTVKSTENVLGSKQDVMVGSVRGINGGNVTKSVSCHQTWFPYLVYYCHSVPKVRAYEVDILDVKSRKKINKGVAICHLDTITWDHNFVAFVALRSTPGKTEACHWVFQNDMTWTIVD